MLTLKNVGFSLFAGLALVGCGPKTSSQDTHENPTSQSSLFTPPPVDTVKATATRKPPPEAFRKMFEQNPQIETLYVPIQGESFLSLQQALAEKGYGKVKASDFKPVFTYQQAQTPQKEIKATVAYTREDLVPDNTTFFTITLHQFIQSVMDDTESQGAVFNPAVADSTHAFDNYQLSILNLYLNSLPNRPEPEPLSIQRMKEGSPTEVAGEKK